MRTRQLIHGTVCALLLVPGMAAACGPDSASTHIGTLSGVDTASGTFSIVDAETRQNLTFHAAPALIETLDGASGMLSVRYEMNGDTLTAIDVRQ